MVDFVLAVVPFYLVLNSQVVLTIHAVGVTKALGALLVCQSLQKEVSIHEFAAHLNVLQKTANINAGVLLQDFNGVTYLLVIHKVSRNVLDEIILEHVGHCNPHIRNSVCSKSHEFGLKVIFKQIFSRH